MVKNSSYTDVWDIERCALCLLGLPGIFGNKKSQKIFQGHVSQLSPLAAFSHHLKGFSSISVDKSFSETIFLFPLSPWFHRISVQPKAVSSLCSVTAAPDAAIGGIAWHGRVPAGASLGRAAAGFCSHLLISVLLLVTKFLLLCGVEWQFSFHSFVEFMGI